MKLKLMGSTCIAGGFIVWDTKKTAKLLNTKQFDSPNLIFIQFFLFIVPILL